MEEKNNEAITEAVLFIAGKFMSIDELVMYTNINPITLKEILQKIEEKYKNADSAFELVVRGENYKLDVKREYSNFVNKLAAGKTEFTKAEQETLAIIAYKQPILQSVVVKIRGNKAYDHIKRLIELSLLKTRRTRHTLELTLSDTFYEYFSTKKTHEEFLGHPKSEDFSAKKSQSDFSAPESLNSVAKKGAEEIDNAVKSVDANLAE